MNNVNITEESVMDELLATAKANGEKAPRAIVVNRTQQNRSLTRKVRIALVVTSNNETLIDALIKKTVDDNLDYSFVGSDVNLQSDLEIDYLFFEVNIFAKINTEN